jgi:hypothetical protein
MTTVSWVDLRFLVGANVVVTLRDGTVKRGVISDAIPRRGLIQLSMEDKSDWLSMKDVVSLESVSLESTGGQSE